MSTAETSTKAALADNRAVTSLLISQPLEWRVRAVEELVIDSATSCQRRRSLQVAPLRTLLADYVTPTHETAILALNVAPMPRGPLMEFDIKGPNGAAWLLPRPEIARRQALYLGDLAAAHGRDLSEPVLSLLTTIVGFTGEWFSRNGPMSLEEYLEEGLGRSITADTVDYWRHVGDECRKILRPRVDEFRDYSAPENPALVIPELFAANIVASDKEASSLLAEYADLLDFLERQAPVDDLPTYADDFLNALADYGRNYDLIAAMEVPLDEPFIVKYSERRNLNISLFANTSQQSVFIADAQSNHISLKVSDPSVRLRQFSAKNFDLSGYAVGAYQPRQDDQSVAIYAHEAEREYRVNLQFSLAPLRRLEVVPYLAAAMLTLLTLALLEQQPNTLRDLAIIAGPAALAASVLLAREPTTLGSRIRLLSSTALFCALTFLLISSAYLYLAE